VRPELGIGLEIGNQDVLATKALAARIHELARSQKDLNSRLISVLVLPLLLGFFLFGFLFGLPLLMLRDALLDAFVFFSCSFPLRGLPSFFTSVVISSPSK